MPGADRSNSKPGAKNVEECRFAGHPSGPPDQPGQSELKDQRFVPVPRVAGHQVIAPVRKWKRVCCLRTGFVRRLTCGTLHHRLVRTRSGSWLRKSNGNITLARTLLPRIRAHGVQDGNEDKV